MILNLAYRGGFFIVQAEVSLDHGAAVWKTFSGTVSVVCALKCLVSHPCDDGEP